MKKIKFFIFSFIFFVCSFFSTITVFARGGNATGEVWTTQQKVVYWETAFAKILADITGVIVPSGLDGRDLKDDFYHYVMGSEVIPQNMTFDEWLASEVNVRYEDGDSGDAEITFSPTIQIELNDFINDWLSENEGFIYGYSWGANSYLSSFRNQSYFTAFRDKVSENADSLYYVTTWSGNGNTGYYAQTIVEYYDCNALVGSGTSTISVTMYKDWATTGLSKRVWSFDTSSSSYSSGTYSGNINGGLLGIISNPSVNNSNGMPTRNIVNGVSTQYLVYKSFSALQSSDQGVQGYYVTDSYNTTNSNNITDSYNTNISNINNTITYGDVENYVNNYYVTNNEYPSTTNINQYINNYVPPENGSGGSGGGDNGSFDWSFLNTIGDFLGGLISGIGEVLSGILSALTDVMDMFIGENGLPNIIGQLVEYFLPFLPDWVPALIGFSVVLALLLGVVKLIRG